MPRQTERLRKRCTVLQKVVIKTLKGNCWQRKEQSPLQGYPCGGLCAMYWYFARQSKNRDRKSRANAIEKIANKLNQKSKSEREQKNASKCN